MAGQRTAVNLAGIEREEIQRGMVLAPPGVFEPTKRLDARITLLASARPLKNRARVHFHQGTAEAIADVVLISRKRIRYRGNLHSRNCDSINRFSCFRATGSSCANFLRS